jgi:hypothetical protein
MGVQNLMRTYPERSDESRSYTYLGRSWKQGIRYCPLRSSFCGILTKMDSFAH